MKPALVKSVIFRWITLVTLAVLPAYPLYAKRKDDVVVMQNGDKFTGEIKGLRYGELEFKADYMKDSVYLDWKKVVLLQSKDAFIVALTNGLRVTATIRAATDKKEAGEQFAIVAAESAATVSPSSVITIEQQENSFWNQLTGSITYGLGFASGNNSANSSLGADVKFDTAKNSVWLATSSQVDTQKNATNTNRFTFDSQYGRALTTRWIAAGLFSLLKSNQQDLALRSTYGGGFGRKLILTDRTTLLAIAGAAYSHETYHVPAGTEASRDNAESLFGITFSTFRFGTLDISSQSFLFPSLTDPGRFRLSSQSRLRIELIRNFTWNLQLYENYDTRPPINAPKNDLGVTTSVGWTF